MKGEFLSLETAELLASQGKRINVTCQLDEAEYETKINDILDNYMDKINEMIINDENEFIIKLLLQRISKTLYHVRSHYDCWEDKDKIISTLLGEDD